MTKRATIAFTVILNFLVGCSGSSSNTSPIKAAKIEMSDFAFKPDVIVVTSAHPVISIVNVGSTTHNFTFKANEIPLDNDVSPDGKNHVLPIAIGGKGTFEFFCKYHVARGMRGTIKYR